MGPGIRELTQDDVDDLQRLLESTPGYTERITGYPPGPADALSALIGVPPNYDARGKRGIGLWQGGLLVAFGDVLLGYPDPRTAYIGLLIVHGSRQRRGLGSLLHQSLLRFIERETTVERLRVGLISLDAGSSEPFWDAMGYASVGETTPYRYDRVTGSVEVWERALHTTTNRSDAT